MLGGHRIGMRRLRGLLGRPLGGLDLHAVMYDDISLHDHAMVLALGITADGRKHLLGLAEGATENAAVVRALLADLLERGLGTERPTLFVTDGGTGPEPGDPRCLRSTRNHPALSGPQEPQSA